MQETPQSIVVAEDGREIDVTRELERLMAIGRYHRAENDLNPSDSKFLHRFGWGLIVTVGAETTLELVDVLEEDWEINPAFATHLRARWTDLITRCA